MKVSEISKDIEKTNSSTSNPTGVAQARAA